MKDPRIDDLCHLLLNYLPVVKGQALAIDKAVEEAGWKDAAEVLKTTCQIKHRAAQFEHAVRGLLLWKDDTVREFACQYAWTYLGTFYRWGGDDPSGFDCSGLVVEVLTAVGKFPRGRDSTAQALWERFRDREIPSPKRGALAFWQGSAGRMIHVELCLSDTLALGASGGGSSTLSLSDAVAHNAFVKVRPVASRGGVRVYADPFADGAASIQLNGG